MREKSTDKANQGDPCTDGISYLISKKLTLEQQPALWF